LLPGGGKRRRRRQSSNSRVSAGGVAADTAYVFEVLDMEVVGAIA